MEKVLGIGGVFFKTPDPEKLKKWYKEHLGIESESWGTQFGVQHIQNADNNAYQVWSPFKEDTTYFAPSSQSFMINFIVADLNALRKQLIEEGVEVLPQFEESEFGKFGWCMDPFGNKIELWEPPKS